MSLVFFSVYIVVIYVSPLVYSVPSFFSVSFLPDCSINSPLLMSFMWDRPCVCGFPIYMRKNFMNLN